MVTLKSLLLVTISAGSVLAAPSEVKKRTETITDNQTGNYGGYYFSNYVETGSNSLTLGTGTYSLKWSSANTDVVSGIGWATGAARTITYTGSLNADNDSLLALYGWTTGPLVEYYVIEKFGTYNPGSAGTHLGTVTTDGSVYDIYETTRTNAPSIQGTATFHQYLSIRQNQRTSGTITFANHIAAWKALGLNLGTWNYQIMATEGYESTGTSSVTINSAGTGGSPPVSSSSPTTSTPASSSPTTGSGTAATYGQCGGIGWTGPTKCPSGWTCKAANAYYSQCLQ